MDIQIVGRKIKEIRPQTKAEYEAEGWMRPSMAIVLEGDYILFASSDDEGNHPGSLFGQDHKQRGFYVLEDKEN
jgi:hypothetical protein